MRKPRDFDAELKALEDKAKQLKARKATQLGELVIATGADALTPDELAGALVALAETRDAGKREAWAKRGASFFAGRSRGRDAAKGSSGPHDGDRQATAANPPVASANTPPATAPAAATGVTRASHGALPLDGGAPSASGGTGAR